MISPKIKNPSSVPLTVRGDLLRLLNDYQVADILGVSVATVRRWRLFDDGPQFIKIGVLVRYHPDSITAFLASRPTGGNSNPEVRE